MRGRKGRVATEERNARDYQIRIGAIPPPRYEDNIDEAIRKAGL